MTKLAVQKVQTRERRELPIFDEIDTIADRIRVRAFSLFRDRGFRAGGDLDDWLAAEREICWPAAELAEEDDEFEIKVALAGFDADDILVTATPREIIVKASRKTERAGDDEHERIHWSQFQDNDAYRRIGLPADIDVRKVEAEFENGMLEIEAPKIAAEKPRKNVRTRAVSAKRTTAVSPKKAKVTAKKKKKRTASKKTAAPK